MFAYESLVLTAFRILLCWQPPEITVEPSDDPKNLSGNWQLVLLELAGSHYAAICIEQDNSNKGSN